MSGFFPLAEAGIRIGKTNHHQTQDQDQDHQQDDDVDSIISPYSLYLFKNEEIYNKGSSFELWQQYYHQHHQQPPHYHDLAVGVGPTSHRRKTNISRVDDLINQNKIHQFASSWNIFRSVEGGGGGGGKVMRQGGYGGIGGGSGGGMNCQDCGNQAKKDCQHMRCRTCCKSRGFHCQTHVKSTWVPAAKRRERQQLISSNQQNSGNQHLSLMMRATGSGGGGGGGGGTGGGGDNQNPKRLRDDHHHHQRSIAVVGGIGSGGSGVILPAQHHHNTSSGLEVGNFPAELSSPAVFRCVRVSAMDEAEEQLAYQTALNIGGHVFKGILYDHGPESRYNHPGEGSSSGCGGGQLQQLNLITSGTTGVTTATTGVSPGGGFIDPNSSTYSTPFGAFMAGTQFFPSTRS